MPLYVAEYLADTGHLTTQEHGAYLLLIMHYWANRCLPTEDKKLARITRMSETDWLAAKDTLFDFFETGWKHPRIEIELAKAEEKHELRVLAGRKGGQAKPKPSFSNAIAKPNQSQTQTQLSEANASDAGASAVERLWSEGLPALMALGVKERQARPMIGRWRSDAGDDCERVLSAILRAREACPADPIPWINASLKERGNGKTESLVAVAKRMAAAGVSFGPRPGTVRDGTGGDIVRLLPPGGRE